MTNRIEKLLTKLEKSLGRQLPAYDRQYSIFEDEVVDLYARVSKIPADKITSKREVNRLLREIENEDDYLYRYLVFHLGSAHYRARQVEFLFGLYDIMLEHNIQLQKMMDSMLAESARAVYDADFLKKKIPLTNDKLQEILTYRINNTHYSRRIWQNTERLGDKLIDAFTLGFQNDMSVDQLSHFVSKITGVGLSATVRLVRTELTAVYNNSLLSYFIEAGVKFVQQISTLDKRTSEICEERHLNKIRVTEGVIGENIPPLHPYCRSIIIPL